MSLRPTERALDPDLGEPIARLIDDAVGQFGPTPLARLMAAHLLMKLAPPAPRTYRPFHHQRRSPPLSETAHYFVFPKFVPDVATRRFWANQHPSPRLLSTSSARRRALGARLVGSLA